MCVVVVVGGVVVDKKKNEDVHCIFFVLCFTVAPCFYSMAVTVYCVLSLDRVSSKIPLEGEANMTTHTMYVIHYIPHHYFFESTTPIMLINIPKKL